MEASPSKPSALSSERDLKEMFAELIAQGAEARVFKMDFLGRPTIVKERFVKKYRHPVLDEKLSSRRVVTEARCIAKCASLGIDAPTVYFVDKHARRLYLEYIDGPTVKAVLFSGVREEEALAFSELMGTIIARMHDSSLVHGDLTTSNIMLRPRKEPPSKQLDLPSAPVLMQQDSASSKQKTQRRKRKAASSSSIGEDPMEIVATASSTASLSSFSSSSSSPSPSPSSSSSTSVASSSSSTIVASPEFAAALADVNARYSMVIVDFGLSYNSTLAEDKAVDLYVLERAFLSTHPNTEHLFAQVLESYRKHSKHGSVVLKKLEEVRARGRKKIAFG